MNQKLKIPSFFHDVLGENPLVHHILLILLFGVGLTLAVILKYPNSYLEIERWRAILAFTLVFDVLAGCISNFTESTNNYYSKSKSKRLIFISIHVHLLVIAFLLNTSIINAVMIWMYTIICSFIINEIESKNQVFIGGFFLSTGIGWILMLEMEKYMTIISIMFMMKVLFSFSVNHYAGYKEEVSIKSD